MSVNIFGNRDVFLSKTAILRLKTDIKEKKSIDPAKYLKNGYLTDGQTAEDRIKIICDTAEKILNKPGFADKINLYIANGWIGLSSPIWSNFGNKRGYPISCFSSYFDNFATEAALEKIKM